jgi:hypothetical protein
MADQGPFPLDALETNRAGRLTDAERQWFKSEDRGFRKSELTGLPGRAVVRGSRFVDSGHAQRPGRVDRRGDRHLVADVMGRTEPTDAWVTGDELTISLRGMGLTLSRVIDSGTQA